MTFPTIARAFIAESAPLPPMQAAFYEYVITAQGLFIRAENECIEACVPVCEVSLRGSAEIAAYAVLRVPRIPARFLWAVWESARRALPNEAMYQFTHAGEWQCARPKQSASPQAVTFDDNADSVVDLHSHNTMAPFFSDTDDTDERGLRFYVVIGRINTNTPEITARVGVYGHHWPVPATMIFDGLGPFKEVAADAALLETESTEFNGLALRAKD